MTSEKIAIVRNWTDAFNRRDFDSAKEHAETALRQTEGTEPGYAGMSYVLLA